MQQMALVVDRLKRVSELVRALKYYAGRTWK
jgi:hypothetical protein